MRWLLFILIGSIPHVAGAMELIPNTSCYVVESHFTGLHEPAVGKQGLLFRIAQKALLHRLNKYDKAKHRRHAPGGEKASKMARIALILFIAPSALSFLGSLWIGFSVLLGAAFIISIGLCIYILATEDNPTSRKIARLILIASAIMVVLGTILLVALIAAFSQH